jgi:hypothetical protein
VVITAPAITERSPATAAAAAAYAGMGCTVVETSLAAASGLDGVPGAAVIAADLGIAECVLGPGVDPALLGPGIEMLAAGGWDVTVLVPSARIGEAHAALRGRPARLQPWWPDGDDSVHFGAPEVP